MEKRALAYFKMLELQFVTKGLEISTCIKGGFFSIEFKGKEIKVTDINHLQAFRETFQNFVRIKRVQFVKRFRNAFIFLDVLLTREDSGRPANRIWRKPTTYNNHPIGHKIPCITEPGIELKHTVD